MKNEEAGKMFPISHRPSPITHHGEARLRWECRRGMLELDIVLARFLEREFARLSPQEVEAFRGLLAYPDTELWGLIQSDKTSENVNMNHVLRLLRAC